MSTLFINLGTGSMAGLLLAVGLVLAYAIFRAMQYERGLARIVWILAIILIPPFLAVIYIISDFLFNAKKRRKQSA